MPSALLSPISLAWLGLLVPLVLLYVLKRRRETRVVGSTLLWELALRDMRAHEIATVVAMRSAVRVLLSRFDPAKLHLAAGHSGLSLAPLQKARAWEAFEALYTQTSQALADDFDIVFGRAFAQAYERALGEAQAKAKESRQ